MSFFDLFSKKQNDSNSDYSESVLKQYVYYFSEIVRDLYQVDFGYEDGQREFRFRFKHDHSVTIGDNYMTIDTYTDYYIQESKDGGYEYIGYKFSSLYQAQIAALLFQNYDMNQFNSVPRYHQLLKQSGYLT